MVAALSRQALSFLPTKTTSGFVVMVIVPGGWENLRIPLCARTAAAQVLPEICATKLLQCCAMAAPNSRHTTGASSCSHIWLRDREALMWLTLTDRLPLEIGVHAGYGSVTASLLEFAYIGF